MLKFLIILFTSIFLGFLYFMDSQQAIDKEIIRNSDDYVIYEDCTSISGRYYCMGYLGGEINE